MNFDLNYIGIIGGAVAIVTAIIAAYQIYMKKQKERLNELVKSRLTDYGIREIEYADSINVDDYDNDPKIGLKSIFKTNSSDSLVFVAYSKFTTNNEVIEFIEYDDRLRAPKNKRFLNYVSPDDRKASYEQYLSYLFEDLKSLNQRISLLKQGSIDRIVFDTEHGGVFYHKVGENELLMGISLN